MKMNTKKMVPLLLFGFSAALQAQEPAGSHVASCGAAKYESYLFAGRQAAQKDAFEEWLAPKIQAMKAVPPSDDETEVKTLPVVFHVVHNGDAVGVNENLADEQILSQIEVLNQDFRRMADTPGYNEHPDGADIQIEFCLARRTPEGQPTNGIDRVLVNRNSWNDMVTIETVLKPQTQWNPEKYINIWVIRIGGGLEGLGGYTTPPSASGLPGLDYGTVPLTSEGIVLDYRAVGSSDIYEDATYLPLNDKGRVATHELGHYFGLRHIWGDESDCSGTDYCDDTPSCLMNTECVLRDSCDQSPEDDMIENYMDYTPDTCKSVFTNDQKARIAAVLENSPRRKTLATSDACQPPAMSAHDNAMDSLALYPNPASEALYLTPGPAGAGSYRIYNMLGQDVASGSVELNTGQTIDISMLKKGVYSLELTAGAATKIFRFIKE